MKLYLIGTAHSFQVGLTDAPDDCYSEFQNLIRDVARSNSIKVIGEEYGNVVSDGFRSLCRQVADELGIHHVFCDLPKRERAGHGLPESDDKSTWDPREQWWLSRINAGEFPVLFVCGADHVASFSAKCAEAGITVEVVAEDWAPEAAIPLKHRPI